MTSSKTFQTKTLLGLPVAAITYQDACDWTLEHAAKGDRAYAVEAANTHVLALARHEPDFGELMCRFDLICPDGMPLVWGLNQSLDEKDRLSDRVYGPTLMLKVFEASENSGVKHFLLGGKQSTLDALVTKFGKIDGGGQIAGVYSPPFGEWPADEFQRICNKISSSGATVVWVGLGCPKQERWIAQNLAELPPSVYFGIGAAFAFHAGEVKQAPDFIQRFGLEWFFRLCMEPKRLWRRYFVYNSLFLYYSVKERVSSY